MNPIDVLKQQGQDTRLPDAPRIHAGMPSNALPVIVWELRSSDFKAFLKHEPVRWAAGSTIAEAVGDLVMSHSEAFGLKVEPLKRP